MTEGDKKRLQQVAIQFKALGEVLMTSEGDRDQDFRRYLALVKKRAVVKLAEDPWLRYWYETVIWHAGIQ